MLVWAHHSRPVAFLRRRRIAKVVKQSIQFFAHAWFGQQTIALSQPVLRRGPHRCEHHRAAVGIAIHLHLGALETGFGRLPHRLAAAVAEELGAQGSLPAAVDTESRSGGLSLPGIHPTAHAGSQISSSSSTSPGNTAPPSRRMAFSSRCGAVATPDSGRAGQISTARCSGNSSQPSWAPLAW
ncbi:MAG: hypothetical protein RLZZ206_3934 [Cyanobacteriota bacterium]